MEVKGDLHLAQALNSSLYAIRTSIRPDWPYGLSSSGLAANADSNGHTCELFCVPFFASSCVASTVDERVPSAYSTSLGSRNLYATYRRFQQS